VGRMQRRQFSVAQGKCSAKALCEGGLEEETEEQQ
jgi:hypothetical protein